ncbi:MAG: hypothetical protein ABIA59_10510 [Candidatus Latescibacterota bacterium]
MKKLFLIILMLLYGTAGAHGLRHSVTEGPAVIIEITYSNGAPFFNQVYEIYRPHDSAVFQRGRTDPMGRIAFVPDSSGTWRIKAFSEGGHGLDISIEAGRSVAPAETVAVPVNTNYANLAEQKAPVDRRQRVLMVLALIFGVFGVISIMIRKKK